MANIFHNFPIAIAHGWPKEQWYVYDLTIILHFIHQGKHLPNFKQKDKKTHVITSIGETLLQARPHQTSKKE